MSPHELKAIREQTALTQKEFAEKIGSSARAIQNWEAGINPIPLGVDILIEYTFKVGRFEKEEIPDRGIKHTLYLTKSELDQEKQIQIIVKLS